MFPYPQNIALINTILKHLRYPRRNFERNQLLDGSISLSPLYPAPTIDLHVRIATVLHQGFP